MAHRGGHVDPVPECEDGIDQHHHQQCEIQQASDTVPTASIRHDAGVLGRICTLIGAQGANISNLEFIARKPDFYRIEVEVELRDHEHLHNLLTALEAESDVAQVSRVRDPALKP